MRKELVSFFKSNEHKHSSSPTQYSLLCAPQLSRKGRNNSENHKSIKS